MPLPSTFPPITFASCAAPSSRPAQGSETSWRNIPSSSKDPEHLRQEEAAYGRLLVALDELVIVPDADVFALVADLATVIDGSNQYSRVVTEHEALHGLLDQLAGREDR